MVGKNKLKRIFDAAKEELHTTILSVDQITIAYYNLFTVKDNSKLITQPQMEIILDRLAKRGRKGYISKLDKYTYRYKYSKNERIQNVNIRKSGPNKKCKPVEYKGKMYGSMRELADTLGLHYSTVSKHYKRNNGDLSALGKNYRR